MKSSFSSCPQHEKFEELAALAAMGELSAFELEHLHHHLADCARCRAAHETFEDMASNDLGVAVAARESVDDLGTSDVDETHAREALRRLRDRLKTDESKLAHTGATAKRAPAFGAANKQSLRAAAMYGIAAALLLAVGLTVGIAYRRSERIVSAERLHSRDLQSVIDSLKKQAKGDSPKEQPRDDSTGSSSTLLRSLEESQKERDVLEKSLAASEAENQQLVLHDREGQEKLADAIRTSEQLKEQLATSDADKRRLAKLEQDSDARLQEALGELYEARQANAQIAAQSGAQQDANADTSAQEASNAGAMIAPTSEADARNLFGARDLHIVDVYDVAGDGKTKRTYGRVYYVEKKLLVFFAFDLQDRQNRKFAVFQAWGYRQANVGKSLNLGLFTADDTKAGRWVLTVNRADVLSHIDAVFVTVEPPGGSAAPRGKKVLYANLVGPPNHP